ncbi:hypothetical protein ZTR_03919 [Talaromyces verruculosus]|nr:hypothetical protein ZTR_03919 [Talaromyces verruculosus]
MSDQLVSAVHNSSESIVEEKEKSAPDQSHIVSETEIEKLKMEVKALTSEVNVLGSKVIEQGIQLQDKTSELENQTSELRELKSELREANKKCIENADSNKNLRNGITDRVSEVMDFLRKHGFRKEVYEKRQDQEMPDDDSIVNGGLIERQKGLDSIWMKDYLLMHGEIDQRKQALQNEREKRSEDIQLLQCELIDQVEQDRATENNNARQQITQLQGEIQRLSNHQVAPEPEIREQAEELDAQQERITQLQHEVQILRDQVAREQGARELAEEQARELAAEGRAAQQEIQRLRDQVAREREAREQAEEQARELAAEGRAAQQEIQRLRDQVALERGAREEAEAEAEAQAREQAWERAAQQERITQIELENQRLTEQAAQLPAAQDQIAAVQAQNDTLTQANDTLRTRVEELQNQQNETQQQNNALEAQRRDDVDLILAILEAAAHRENILAYHYNALLRQYDITRNDNEQLVQALVNTVNRYEDELAIVLCQMAEIAQLPEANDTNPRRYQPRSRPELRLVQNGSQRHSEYVKSCPSLDLSSNISEHVSLRCFLPGH